METNKTTRIRPLVIALILSLTLAYITYRLTDNYNLSEKSYECEILEVYTTGPGYKVSPRWGAIVLVKEQNAKYQLNLEPLSYYNAKTAKEQGMNLWYKFSQRDIDEMNGNYSWLKSLGYPMIMTLSGLASFILIIAIAVTASYND